MNKGIKSAHKKFWDVERGVTYIPWSKVKVEELDGYREGGMLDAETLNPGKQSYSFSLARFHLLEAESNLPLYLILVFSIVQSGILPKMSIS